MDGETFTVDPDFSVIFGWRSTLSLIGLSTGIVGYWLMERQWDNEGPNAFQVTHEIGDDDAVENGISRSYHNMNDPDKVVGQAFHHSGARDLVRVRSDEGTDENYHPEKAAANQPGSSVEAALYHGTPEADIQAGLAKAFPMPKIMLIGLGIWSLSFFLDPAIGGFRLYANFWNISCFVLAAALGPILALPMRSAILQRDFEYKKQAIVAFLAVSVLLCIAVIVDPEVDGPWYFNAFGTLFILASPVVFMTSRKMGFTWLLGGKAKINPNLQVQNLGPLLLIFGAFLVWAGTNAVAMADLNQSYIPFWTSSPRGWFVFIAGIIFIVPGQLAMDLAFDQGSIPSPGFKGYVYKLNGDTFAALARNNITRFDVVWLARWLEAPILGSIGWFLMGLSCFMPFGIRDPTIQKFFAMFICFAVPVIQFLFVAPALWRTDAEAYQKWLNVYYGLMAVLVIVVGFSHGIAIILSLYGVALIISGQRKDFYDERKLGHLWLTGETPTVNSNPQVFGLGQPLYIVGWIMLCMAMSIPM